MNLKICSKGPSKQETKEIGICQAQSSSSTARLSLSLFSIYPATRHDPTIRPAGTIVFNQQTNCFF